MAFILTFIILGLILAVPLAIITVALPAGWRAGFVNSVTGVGVLIIRLAVVAVITPPKLSLACHGGALSF